MSWEPIDIENIHKLALRHTFCPYYTSKERAHAADIIFMPYNYLIDSKARSNYDIDWQNSIMIIDEAHNIAQVAEEATSFDLKI